MIFPAYRVQGEGGSGDAQHEERGQPLSAAAAD